MLEFCFSFTFADTCRVHFFINVKMATEFYEQSLDEGCHTESIRTTTIEITDGKMAPKKKPEEKKSDEWKNKAKQVISKFFKKSEVIQSNFLSCICVIVNVLKKLLHFESDVFNCNIVYVLLTFFSLDRVSLSPDHRIRHAH